MPAKSEGDLARHLMDRALTDSHLLTNGLRRFAWEIADVCRSAGLERFRSLSPSDLTYNHRKVDEPKSFDDLIVDIHTSLLDYGLRGSIPQGIPENVKRACGWASQKALFDYQSSIKPYSQEVLTLMGEIGAAKIAYEIANTIYHDKNDQQFNERMSGTLGKIGYFLRGRKMIADRDLAELLQYKQERMAAYHALLVKFDLMLVGRAQ